MSEENDWRKEAKETRFNFFRSLKFMVGIIVEVATAALIVGGIRILQTIIPSELHFLGFEVHQIALVLELFVLIAFFVSMCIGHFQHLFEDQIHWIRTKMGW
jgi:uncharacterized metal-binding protein